jgi:hypothetical protein
MSLKSMPKSFNLSCNKVFYPHFFNTDSNFNYKSRYPEPTYYGADFMSDYERREFLAWLEDQRVIHSISRLNCWLIVWMTLKY